MDNRRDRRVRSGTRSRPARRTASPGTSLYRAATAPYDKYRLTNIGQAKRSKLLHLKRPWLVPIADTRVTAAYRDRSGAWAEELGIASGHWEAAREDLIAAAATSACSQQELRIQGKTPQS